MCASWLHSSISNVSSIFSHPNLRKSLLVEELTGVCSILQPKGGDRPCVSITHRLSPRASESLSLYTRNHKLPLERISLALLSGSDKSAVAAGQGHISQTTGGRCGRKVGCGGSGHSACTSGGRGRTHRKLERATLSHLLATNHWCFCRLCPITSLRSPHGSRDHSSMLCFPKTPVRNLEFGEGYSEDLH